MFGLWTVTERCEYIDSFVYVNISLQIEGSVRKVGLSGTMKASGT